MERFKGILKIVGTLCISGFFIGMVTFYSLVVSGWFPSLQELWVTTAMTTLNHKWLATAFISQDKINDIMEVTKVDDTGYNTDISMITTKPIEYQNGLIKGLYTTESIIGFGTKYTYMSEEDTYKSQGYKELSNGVFFKTTGGTGWKGYLLLVKDPSRVSLAQTKKQFSRGDTVKSMVKNSGALIGINAGGFVDGPNYDSNGGVPAGMLIVNNQVINSSEYAKHSVIGFNKDNVLVLSKMTKQEAINSGIRDCVEFKPYLIVNGETIVKRGTGGWGIAPRTALGQRKTGEIIFLCVDGRQAHSIGVDIKVLQDTLQAEGCINAAMVDGGSSTVMYHKDLGYLNKPSLGHERYINNAWIIK